MAKQSINIGSVANDGTGDNLRAGAIKVNANTDELYTALGTGSALSIAVSGASDGQLLAYNNSNSRFEPTTLDIRKDTSPQLAGDLDVVTHSIVSTSNRNIAITPNGSGKVILDGLSHPTADGTNGQVLTTDGSGNLSFANPATTLTVKDESSSSSSIALLTDSLSILGGTNIQTQLSGSELTISLTSNVVTETSTDTLTNKTINGPDNTITNLVDANLSGSAAIANSKLANSTITFGSASAALGTTVSSFTNIGMTNTTAVIDSQTTGNKIRFDFANAAGRPTASSYRGAFATTNDNAKAFYSESGSWIEILSENSSVGGHTDVDTSTVSPRDGQLLVYDGSTGIWKPGNFSKTEKPAIAMLKVEPNGSSAFRFTSHYGTTDNPTIYALEGTTIAFDLTSVTGSHPFVLQSSSGAYNAGNRLSTGLTHYATNGVATTGTSANNQTDGYLYYEVQQGSAGNVYYVCQNHSAMAGTLTIKAISAI